VIAEGWQHSVALDGGTNFALGDRHNAALGGSVDSIQPYRGRRPRPILSARREGVGFLVNHLASPTRPKIIFSRFQPKKTHVKPRIHLTLYYSMLSKWHVSYPQPAILNIDRKYIDRNQPAQDSPPWALIRFRKKTLKEDDVLSRIYGEGTGTKPFY